MKTTASVQKVGRRGTAIPTSGLAGLGVPSAHTFLIHSVGVKTASSADKVGRRGTAIPTIQLVGLGVPSAHTFCMESLGMRVCLAYLSAIPYGPPLP